MTRIVYDVAKVMNFQRQCNSAEEYLSLCNAFYKQLAEAVKSGEYPLYDEQAGEEEKPYTTAYFAVLVEVILCRCRTSEWCKEGHDTPPSESYQSHILAERFKQSITFVKEFF
jgi:hypothetical protein